MFVCLEAETLTTRIRDLFTSALKAKAMYEVYMINGVDRGYDAIR